MAKVKLFMTIGFKAVGFKAAGFKTAGFKTVGVKIRKSKTKRVIRSLSSLCLVTFCGGVASSLNAGSYSLDDAISRAQAQDPWMIGSERRQESLVAQSIYSGTLPDPTVSVGLANMPVDSFDFSQEGMTQLKVGVSQKFPRGKTRSLQREKLEKLSQIQPFAREERKAAVAVSVAHLWLEVYRSQKSIHLIEKDRALFEHLVDVAQSSYTTASARTRQQDLVRAQLELTRLEDRLTKLYLKRDVQLANLGEWLSDPSIEIVNGLMPKMRKDILNANLLTMLNQHPALKSIEQKINAFSTGVELAKQSYKPQWGLNASYAYRDQDPMGRERADFFSVGVSFDVPLFTGKRQDKKVRAATADKEALKTERALMLRKLKAGYDSTQAQYKRLQQRKKLFDQRLLREMNAQAEAALTAYTNDDGDFAEVVRARIAELNARIDALNIDVDIHKTIAQLNYFFTASPSGQQGPVSVSAIENLQGENHE